MQRQVIHNVTLSEWHAISSTNSTPIMELQVRAQDRITSTENQGIRLVLTKNHLNLKYSLMKISPGGQIVGELVLSTDIAVLCY